MVVKFSGRARSFFSLLLAATAVQWTGLMGVSTPAAIAQTTVRAEILLEPSDEESYKVFIARAEANAAVKAQALFDQDLLRTEVRVMILGQRSAAIAPVLQLRVSRQEWTAYPDAEIWSVYYPESKNLLLFDESPLMTAEEPEEVVEEEAVGDRLALFLTNPDTGNRYLLTGIGTWAEAQSEAAALGGSLVVINDQAEQNWLVSIFGDGVVPSDGLVNNQPQPTAGFWIGLSDVATEGEFVWINGDPVTYTNFAFAEPNNISPEGFEEDYGAIVFGGTLGSGGVWTDQSQDRVQLRGIVEVPVDAELSEEGAEPVVSPAAPTPPTTVETEPAASGDEPEATAEPVTDGETPTTTEETTNEATEETTSETTDNEPEAENEDDDNGLPSRTVPTLVR